MKTSTAVVALVAICVLGAVSAEQPPMASFPDFLNSNHLQKQFADGSPCLQAEVNKPMCVELTETWTVARQTAGTAINVPRTATVKILHRCMLRAPNWYINKKEYLWTSENKPC